LLLFFLEPLLLNLRGDPADTKETRPADSTRRIDGAANLANFIVVLGSLPTKLIDLNGKVKLEL
jgi:hypothetical protein